MFSELSVDVLNIIVSYALRDYYSLLFVNQIISEIVYDYIYSFDIDFSSRSAKKGDELYFIINSKVLRNGISNIKNINIYSKHVYLPNFSINILVEQCDIIFYIIFFLICKNYYSIIIIIQFL